MKLFFIIIIFIFFHSCSFDNKTGIWKNNNDISNKIKKETDAFKDFKDISSSKESFNEEILINKEFKFNLTNSINNLIWKDIYYNRENSSKNFKYNDLNEIIFKSKKTTKYQISEHLLFENNNVIINDDKGNIIIFSINQNKLITKFNFYKKKYKKIKKKLNIIVENNILYVSDNIGYLYAFDYRKNKIIWAKNYKIPFRSNLKIENNMLIGANQNNNLFFFNKSNGEIENSIPTEKTIIKNDFINNLSSNEKYIYFLNTYGSLYSIEKKSMRINWFINLNQSLELNPSNLFNGNQILSNSKVVVVSSNHFTNVINPFNGKIIYKKNFSSSVKPLIIDNFLFLITENNLLVAINLNDGKIIYSLDINTEIAKFLNIKKKKTNVKNIIMLNDKIFVFLNNSYFLKFNVRGNLEKIDKLPLKLNSHPMIINGSMIYLNDKNRISVID